MARIIRIEPAGRLGNRMFQYLLAHVLQSHVPAAQITGLSLPEFGIADANLAPPAGVEFDIPRHVFSFRDALETLRANSDSVVRLSGPSMRMEYYRRHLDLARRIFPADPGLAMGYGPQNIVIHIRGGDTFAGNHPNYGLLPIAWYRELVAASRLEPVFVGELDDHPYCQALRSAFPGAVPAARQHIR